jgi:hypothetical protein
MNLSRFALDYAAAKVVANDSRQAAIAAKRR